VNQFIRTVALIALLTVVRSNASEYAQTNSMPANVRSLMETEGYVFNQKLLYNSTPDTNSLRHYVVNKRQRFDLLELTSKKKGWSIWDNSSIKYLQRNTKTATLSFSQFEYDIYYPFNF
jgi:diacylglycerol kinase family enzyme